MATSLSEGTRLRPKGTVVRLPRHRPADSTTLGFEGSLEGLVVIKEDERLDADWVAELHKVLGTARMLWNQSLLIPNPRSLDPEMRLQFRTAEVIVEEIRERDARLTKLEAPQQQICATLDSELASRAVCAARLGRR